MTAPSSSSVFAPSDLRSCPEGPVRVAGRWRHDGPGRGRLADGLAAVVVEPAHAIQADEGDLVELEARLVSGALTGARLVARHGPPSVAGHDDRRWSSGEARRLQDDGVGRRLELRAAVMRTIRRFFEARGFVEVDTPAVVPSPGLDVHLAAFGLAESVGGRPAYLCTSPEYQMKRLLVGGMPRIFQLAHAFRRDEAGPQHNPEFLLLEWYRAFADAEELMLETEQLVREVLRSHGSRSPAASDGAPLDLDRPFLHWSMGEAFEHLAPQQGDPVALAERDEDRFFRCWVDRIEPGLAALHQPVFITDFPAVFASLARRKPDAPRLCERFELYLAGVELCNGFGELCDPVEQRRRFEQDRASRGQHHKPVYPIDERFLAALEEGMPPSAGNALGVDRLVALCAGTPSIAEVQPFPVSWL